MGQIRRPHAPPCRGTCALTVRLDAKAIGLQLEQQQELCIARLLPLKPEIILMGEFMEHRRTKELFLNSKNPKTAEYIEGRYG